ncbi:MAG: hypothetical protein M3Y60_12785 [Bacteroidota bacterium]|nr:hypothetical protein [Bacteroidota bacterium]
MANKKILLIIDSDRFAFPLLHYLTANAKLFSWKIRIGTMFDDRVADGIRAENFPVALEFVNFKKQQDCDQAIKKSDLVIGLVQDATLLQIADRCIAYRKTLISPARLNRQMALKRTEAKENNTLILMDCGFSPGLDHIIAKKAIDNIHSRGGKITSFKTFNGTFLSESSDENPLQFKLTEPVADVLGWGKHNNRHLINGRMQHIPCHRLFERSEPVMIHEREHRMIPEGDSLYYRKIYDLANAHTVLKGKLVQKGFDNVWNALVKLGLTDSASRIDFIGEASYLTLVDSLLPIHPTATVEERLQQYTGADTEVIEKLRWLGLFDDRPWDEVPRESSPAQLLQLLLVQKLTMHPDDKDAVKMEHHLAYEFRDELFEFTATLVIEGDNARDSALAKVTGFTCGAAAKSVLLGSITNKGLHIPILREIYDPILNELEEQGIAFHVNEKKTQTAEAFQTLS